MSLPELMIGMVISLMVITAGTIAIVMIQRGNNREQRELARRDDVARVLDLLQDEVRAAQRVETGTSATPLARIDTANCSDSITTPNLKTILVLRGYTGNADISYATDMRADTNWRGPNVLVRCGPPYNANASLDATSRREDVVLDTLQSNGFNVTSQSTSNSGLSRTVQLSLITLASGTPVTDTAQVAINSTQTYGLQQAQSSGLPVDCTTPSTGCLDPAGTSLYFRASSTQSQTLTGNKSLEVVVYFDGNRNQFTISSCTLLTCAVNRISPAITTTITDGDVLIFYDAQIRL